MINFDMKLLMTVCVIAGAISLVSCGIIGEDATPREARKIRRDARFFYEKANEAHNEMVDAEKNNDVEGYEKWRNIMREWDRKLNAAVERYDEIRDYLEAKIWNGELIIDGFTKRYQKSDLRSITDYLTLNVRN